MVGIEKPFMHAKPRDLWFRDDQIKILWQAAATMGGHDERFLKMLLITGKRKTALSQMEWADIDDTWFWTPSVPAQKNKRLHPIPLPVLAQRVIGPRKASGLVFADDGKVSASILSDNGLMNTVKRITGFERFILHACRHSVETHMAILGIAPHLRDLLLDHAPARGSGAGYDHHSYKNEMRAAMELWAGHVESLVKPSLRVVN
jgi:integrase